MKNEDKEAFVKWYSKETASVLWEDFNGDEIVVKAWQAACEHKQKEIDDLLAENEKLRKVVFKNIQGHQFARMVLREACFHGAADDMTDFIDLCHASLKELDEKL